ncbi:MAG: cell division protein ZapA [Chitinophagaceae bacterium]|nr:cell division protein ZapA [Chitinophagaceae bacterium]
MESLIPINVVIGDRTYRIRIDPKDEETVRGTVKIINDKVIEYKTQFAGKDMQDYIGMVVLWYATQQKAAENQPPEFAEIAEKLNQLEAMLDKPLQ